jgi:urocanate hydratase
MNALGVSQYANDSGSYMYIGPQGIVHGTITVLNAFRKIKRSRQEAFSYFRTRWLSGAQPKAGNIAGCITVCAEVNAKITTFVTAKAGSTKLSKILMN